MVDGPAAASRLGQELDALRAAAQLTFGQISLQAKRQKPAITLSKSTLSEWFSGSSVPRAGRPFRFLITFLESRAPAGSSRSPEQWEVLRRNAERSKAARSEASVPVIREALASTRNGSVRGTPLRLGLVPETGSGFVERDEGDCLARALEADQHAAARDRSRRVQGRVVTGTGGVGKSSLAAHYCHAVAANGVDVLMWVAAGTAQAVAGSYAQAARALGLAADGEDTLLAAQQFMNWLRTTTCDWLIVLDDVPSPGALEGLWPPRQTQGRGRVVITTRSRESDLAVLSGHSFLPIGLFSPQEALRHLRGTLRRSVLTDSDDDLAELAGDLGHLPLALSRAAAYLDYNPSCTVTRYRQLLADRRLTLDRLTPAVRGSVTDRSLAALWDISIEQADEHTQGMARPMMELAAVLDGTAGIPDALFTTESARAYLTAGSGAGRDTDELDAEHTLATLDRLNLLDHTSAGAGCTDWLVRVHQLIQRAVREYQPPSETHDARAARRAAVVPACADALLDIWPQAEQDQEHAQRLRASAHVLSGHDLDEPRPLWQNDTVHSLFHRHGVSIGESGGILSAVSHFAALAQLAHERLGRDHPFTVMVRMEYARWTSTAGSHRDAVAILEELEDRHSRLHGPDDPVTLVIRHNLAVTRGEAGDVLGAVRALEEVLADRRRTQATRSVILATLHNLAYWKGACEDATGAIGIYQELIPQMEEEYGADNEHTLTARHNLARWQGESGDAGAAVTSLQALLQDQRRALGQRHPRVLFTRQSLHRWQGEAGESDNAFDGYQKLIPDMREVLGPDHPEVITARHNFAHLRGNAGHHAEAVSALEEVVADRARIFGPHHPDTFGSRCSLAFQRGQAGFPGEAVQDLEQLLRDQQQHLAAGHPNNLSVRHQLTVMRHRAGDTAAATSALNEVLAEQIRVLGPGHPRTRAAFNTLDQWQSTSTDASSAADTYRQLLTHIRRHPDLDNPLVLAVQDRLAMWQGRAGDPTGAVQVLTTMLRDASRLLSPDDPLIPVIANNIFGWLQAAGVPADVAASHVHRLCAEHSSPPPGSQL
ncbi:tetratricopeptide repeat protein [Streptomyces sp. NPDC093084]|uniref:tetratricopeptide repeat protein n=1 Tax=Streptomyces sp. NPDC093084 TaxID=3155197 RepID=UPI00343EAC5A